MRKGFIKPLNDFDKIFVGCKLPYHIVKKMEKYHKRCERSKFIEDAIILKIATLDSAKEIEKMEEKNQ